MNFDSLLSRTEAAARSIRANGFLNTVRDEDSGAIVGYEVRLQPNPLYALWRDRRFGFSRTCRSAEDVVSYTDMILSRAAAHAEGIAADDPAALDAVLEPPVPRG